MIDSAPDSVLPPPSDTHLKEFEAYYGIVLPADYRAFLTHCNGCVPLRRHFLLGANERSIERFLPVLDDAAGDAEHGWADVEVIASQLDSRLASDPDGDGIDLVPIAALFGGDFVVLDYRGAPDTPSVAVWDHESSTDFAPAVRTVSAGFTEFLAQLRS